MTHTHTIESGNSRVSVEADDAARAVSEARRNWELNSGGVVSDDIANKIADARELLVHVRAEMRKLAGGAENAFFKAVGLGEDGAFEQLIQCAEALIQRAEAAERERDALAAVVQMMVDYGAGNDGPLTHEEFDAKYPECVGRDALVVIAERAATALSASAGDGGNGK